MEEPLEVPTDLVRLGFRLVVRESSTVPIFRTSDRWPVALQTIQRRRYLLISQNRGIAVGVTMVEAIQCARKIAGLCTYVDKKRAEEAQQ